jgi:glycosyltransferase involved in cell wall biosynthesis
VKISASLIVKNEESVMQRCLDCVSKWADEIVVVDTGSTDSTMEICRAHPKVKLYESEHFNKNTHYSDFQFNVAKNESIAKCTGDWVCWWDADDFIDEDGAQRIRRLAGETKEDYLFTFICSYGSLRFEHCRMFRNGSGVEFDKHHSCHEYLNSGGRQQFLRNEIVVQHLPGKKGVPSVVRNMAILEKDYNERGYRDQRTMFYLANSYREMGRHDDAVNLYNEYLKVSEWREERYFATLYKAQIFSFVGNFKDAFKAIYESFIEDDRFAEGYCLMGDIMLHQKKYDKARHWYHLAQTLELPADSRLFAQRQVYNEYPKKKLAEIDEKQMEPEPKKVEPKPDKGRQYKYRLPEDNQNAAAALAALSRIAEEGKWVTAIPNNDVQRKMIASCSSVDEAEGDGMELSLPGNLRDKVKVEWYIRAAGFVLVGPFPEPLEVKDVA